MTGGLRPDGGGAGDVHGLILDVIYGHYKDALQMLPLEEIPELAPKLLEAGFCFGFADPVTNIIANTLCPFPDEDSESGTSCVKRQKKMMKTETLREATTREEVLSKIVAASDVPSPSEARTIAERSLKGLVIFLTTYFRHLATRDARSYLCLARADLMVAVRLIELDRCLCCKDQF